VYNVECSNAVSVPVAAALLTSDATEANERVVLVTAVTVRIPSKAASAVSIATLTCWPTPIECEALNVNVATLLASALLVTDREDALDEACPNTL
jgi:hypothetical protein